MEIHTIGTTPKKLEDEIREMCDKAVKMLRLTEEGFREQDIRPLRLAEKLGQQIHQQEKFLTTWVTRKAHGRARLFCFEPDICFIPLHLERVGDNIELLIRAIKKMFQEDVAFTGQAAEEIGVLMEKAIKIIERIRDAIPDRTKAALLGILKTGEEYEATANEFAFSHQQRLVEGICLPKASSIYVAMLDDLKGIGWHCHLIAQKLNAVLVF